ncbi:MAG TPA: hypothetical protein PLB18_04310 [Acidobacteriota bacterium]|nr:hypothetical protein [Acidobacteriota bacterium]
MDWNDPNNFQFVVQVLCNQKDRIKSFWEHYFPLAQGYNYATTNYWQQVWPLRFAPNATIDWWRIETVDPETTPPSVPGPVWQLVPGGAWRAINLAHDIPGLEVDMREQIKKKAGWETVPSWEEIRDALDAQLYTEAETPFSPYWGDGRFYREEFISFLLSRAKILWETEEGVTEDTTCYLGAGRVTPRPDENRPEGEFKNLVYFVTNESNGIIRCYKIRCGCACCPPCGCNGT